MDISLDLKCRTSMTSDHLIRLQVWVDSAVNIPQEIFLMRHIPLSPGSAHSQEIFARRCNYSDLMNYTALGPDDVRQHYRVSSLDLVFTSIQEATSFFTDCKTASQDLIDDVYACTDSSPVGSTYDCSGVCDLNMSTVTAPGKSVKCSLTLVSKGIYTETNFFLIRKLNSSLSSISDNTELVAITSPEDVLTYGTEETYPTFYRTNTMTLVVSDSTKLDTVLTTIKADLTLATTAYKTPLTPLSEYSVSETVTNAPLYGS